jgi:hypothetical protein
MKKCLSLSIKLMILDLNEERGEKERRKGSRALK